MCGFGWEKNIRRVVPYTPGEQPTGDGIIKLNTNENPYSPCDGVKKALLDFKADRLRLYPDTDSKELTAALAGFLGVSENRVFLGVGSDDVISMAFLTFFSSGKPVFFPDVTYSFYDVWASVYGIPFETKPIDENFKINHDDYKGENGGIIFPNPNAPTGVCESTETVEKILLQNPDSVVIVDEAYIDFGGKSCIGLIDKYDNLLVVQTFSKSRSLAGARIGFAVGNEKLIKYLNDVKFSVNSYTMNALSQTVGVESVKDRDYFKTTTDKIIATRERTKAKLKTLGFSFPDSMANFIFASHSEVPADVLFKKLKERKIFVRHWNKPRIDNYLRITVGTDEQMNSLISALEEIIKEERGNAI